MGVAVTVDAAWSVPRIRRYADKLGVRVVGALYTHGHFDHVGGQVSGRPSVKGLPAFLVTSLQAARTFLSGSVPAISPQPRGKRVCMSSRSRPSRMGRACFP